MNAQYYPTAGHPDDTLIFWPTVAKCGPIEDGVHLEHASETGPKRGGWVIAFADLEDMYKRAKSARESSCPPS